MAPARANGGANPGAVDATDVVGAQSEPEGKVKTDPHVEHGGDHNADHAPPESRLLEYHQAEASGGGGQLAGGQCHVPHFQSQPEKRGKSRDQTQHQPERHIGRQTRDVVAHELRPTPGTLNPQSCSDFGVVAQGRVSRCSTNQFSTQPAMMLDANSSTPVSTANS